MFLRPLSAPPGRTGQPHTAAAVSDGYSGQISGGFSTEERSGASPSPSVVGWEPQTSAAVFDRQVAALCAKARRDARADAAYYEQVLAARRSRWPPQRDTDGNQGKCHPPPPPPLASHDDAAVHGLPVFRALSSPSASPLPAAGTPPQGQCGDPPTDGKKTVHFQMARPRSSTTVRSLSPMASAAAFSGGDDQGAAPDDATALADDVQQPSSDAGDVPCRPNSAATMRRRLGLPKAIAEPLQMQIAGDADQTYARLRDAFVGNLDRGTTKVVSVLRLTNESTRSMHAMQETATASSAPSGDGGGSSTGPPDFHWFAARNIVLETVAGISNDAFGLAACALRGASESEQLQLKAFAHQARRGFPVGGFVPAHEHPMAVVFEPAVGSEFESTAAPDGGLRIKCNLKVLLVGSARRQQAPEQSMAGHTSNVRGQRILKHTTAATYNARVDAEQRHRKDARARRMQANGHNPHFLRTKPHCAVPYGNSILVHSCDDLLVSASGWIDMPSDGPNRDALRPDGTQANFALTRSSGKRVFPQSLRDLLEAKEVAALQPLRPQKTVHGVKSYPSFIGHEELFFEPQYMVVYEEPEPALDLGELLAELDDALHPNNGKPPSGATKHGAAADGSDATAGGQPKHRPPRKAVDLTRVMVNPRDLRKALHQPFGVMEYTTRWGGQIESVARSIANDVTVRRWTTFPDDVRAKALPVPFLLDVCRHGSASIDVKNADGVVQYRHSFTFGVPHHPLTARQH